MYFYSRTQSGFTLIELSIVLLIIGLIVGGVLVGQDLVRSSAIRATITQIERYNTAVNTFRGKYNALPGDLNNTTATTFGFVARGPYPGEGDGNGLIEGSDSNLAEGFEQYGETLIFWSDLTVGNASASMSNNLIDGTFNTFTNPNGARVTITAANAYQYYPAAKLGQGNFIYVYSTKSVNYFGIAPMTATSSVPNTLTAALTAQQAWQIDKKMDDGYPVTGNVTATWDSGTLAENATAPAVNGAATDSVTSCYNSSTAAGAYSLSISGGSNVNCALSFRFQ